MVLFLAAAGLGEDKVVVAVACFVGTTFKLVIVPRSHRFT